MEHKPGPHEILAALLLVQSLLERRSEAFFAPFGLTGAQFNILNLLAYRNGRIDQAALVDLVLVGKSSVSIVLNRMVRAGLLTRAEHPKDRRQTVLILTAKGRALWRKVSPRYEGSVQEVFGTLKKEKAVTFLETLETLYTALRKDDRAPAAAECAPTLQEMLVRVSQV